MTTSLNISNLRLSQAQIEAANKAVSEMLSADKKQDTIDSLTALIQMKEKAINTLYEQLEEDVCRLAHSGISAASVAVVADGYTQAIRTAAGQMVIFANQLSQLAHNEDMATAYQHIAESTDKKVCKLLEPYQAMQERILSDVEEAVFLEIYETYHHCY